MQKTEFYWLYVYKDAKHNNNVKFTNNLLEKLWSEYVSDENNHPIVLDKVLYTTCSFGNMLKMEKYVKEKLKSGKIEKEIMEIEFNKENNTEILINEQRVEAVLQKLLEKCKKISIENDINSKLYREAMKIKYYNDEVRI